MTDPTRPPRDNIVRASRPGLELRAADDTTDDGRIGTLTGHFSVFDAWYEVDSVWEGHFIERIAPGAFKKTFAENRDGMRVTFNHGQDPQLGDKVLGPIERLEEDGVGAAYEVPLLDTTYNRDLLPGLRAGLYGASFRFRVMKEEFNQKPSRSAHNPEGIPERTIKEVHVMEFGPVTFPASPTATAAVRSLTDVYAMRQFTRDPERLASLIDAIEANALPPEEPVPATPDDESRDAPPAPPPEVAEPTESPETRQTAGSLDSRKESDPVEYITRDEKVSRVSELKASLNVLANEYPGVMPADAQLRWDDENKELDTLERDIAAWDARQARLADLAGKPGAQEDAVPPYQAPATIRKVSDESLWDIAAIERTSRSHEDRDQRLRDNALRAIEQTRFLGPGVNDQADVKARVSQLVDYGDSDDKEVARLVLSTGSPQYRRAFQRYVATGGSERAAALAVGVDGTGGFSVPVAFDPTIIGVGAHTTVNPYRTACRVVNITGTDTWQALTSTAVVSAYALEAAAATEQGPTFVRPEFIVKRAHSFVTASYEMAQDRPDLPAELAVLFSESKDNLEEAQFTTGVGTTVFPQGMFLDGAFTAVETIGNNVVAIADIYALESALPIRHRANAAWFLNRSVIHTIQGFETAGGILFNGANYPSVGVAQQNPGGNTGLRLLGYPVWEVPSASSLITTSAAIVAVFADPRNYVIVDRVGMSVKVIPDMLNGATPSFPTGEIGIYAFWRNTARVLNVDGGRQLKVNAP